MQQPLPNAPPPGCDAPARATPAVPPASSLIRWLNLPLFAALAVVASPDPARACSPPPSGWGFSDFGPRLSGGELVVPSEGPLVIDGEAFTPVEFDDIAAVLVVDVRDADGQPVPGSLAMLAAPGDFGWFPDQPLDATATYDFTLSHAPDQVRTFWLPDAADTFTVIEPPPPATASVVSADVITYDADVLGPCRDDDIVDSCGGCSPEVIGTERRWRITAQYAISSDLFARYRGMRSAVGADPTEAYAILDRTPLQSLWAPDGVLRRQGGLVGGWPSHEACIAVEIHDPLAGLLVRDAICDAVPGASQEPVVEPPVSVAADEGGCAVVRPGGSGTGGVDFGAGLGAGVLMLGLGVMRRRRLSVVLALLALGLFAGCDGSEGGDDTEPEPAPCLDAECAQTSRALPALTDSLDVPPISGGTLAVSATHRIGVVADSDRDRVVLVDLDARAIIATIDAPGEPGRVVIDEARGQAHIALRSGGAVLTVGLDGRDAKRHPVCAAPRGLALDGERLFVACAGGWLLTLDANGRELRRVAVAPDLRDVIVAGGRLHVTRFRTAELLTLDAEGAIIARRRPVTEDVLLDELATAPTVAWRTIALPDGRMLMLHQRARLASIVVEQPGGYGSGFDGCPTSIVATTLTVFGADPAEAPIELGRVPQATLAVDVALVRDALVIAAPGNAFVGGFRNVHTVVWLSGALNASGPCLDGGGGLRPESGRPEITAVAADGDAIVALRREPPALFIGDAMVELPGASVMDTGHDVFHKNTGNGIACASCHPEASEDGHSWLFEGHGLRRTQELRGGIAGSEPFHWTGDMRDMGHLMDEVMTRRMSGPVIPKAYAKALLAWIDARPVEVVDAIAVGVPSAPGAGDAAAGEVVFGDAVVGCAVCHSGARLSDGLRHDVGSGGFFETATLLGVGRRGALMHDGCGETLADRFDAACGGGDDHGRTSHLSAEELADLVAYLATL